MLPSNWRTRLEDDIHHFGEKIGHRCLWFKYRDQLEKAACYIESELRKHYPAVEPEFFDVPKSLFKNLERDETVRNLVVEVKGTSVPEEIIIVGAHYDTFPLDKWDSEDEPNEHERGTPGANDNGSGVAATLALARHFADRPQKRTLRFVFFVNEEPPFFRTQYMGSHHHARRCWKNNEKIVVMITPETIGCYRDEPEPKGFSAHLAYIYTWFMTGMPADARHVAFLCDENSHQMALDAQEFFVRHVPKVPVRVACLASLIRDKWRRSLFQWTSSSGAFERAALERCGDLGLPLPSRRWSDDSPFWQYGYRAFAVTDTAYLRYKHYHEPGDLPKNDRMNYPQMEHVVEGLCRLLEEWANPPNLLCKTTSASSLAPRESYPAARSR